MKLLFWLATLVASTLSTPIAIARYWDLDDHLHYLYLNDYDFNAHHWVEHDPEVYLSQRLIRRWEWI